MIQLFSLFLSIFGDFLKMFVEFANKLPIIEIWHLRYSENLIFTKKSTSKLIDLIFCIIRAYWTFLRLALLSMLFLGIMIILLWGMELG